MTHQVEELHFLDGSIYISNRSDNRTNEDILRDGQRLENTSPVYIKLRTPGMFLGKKVVFSNVGKHEGDTKAKTLLDYYRSAGRKVLNKKM